MALMKQHENRRLNEAQDARQLRKLGVSIHDAAAVGQDFDSIARIENLSKLPWGLPLVVQDVSGGFYYLPGVDGPVPPQ